MGDLLLHLPANHKAPESAQEPGLETRGAFPAPGEEPKTRCSRYIIGCDSNNFQRLHSEQHKFIRIDCFLLAGTYTPDAEVVRIGSFQSSVLVLASKQRPRRLTIMGSDGKPYMFLLKGHEDLRQVG